MRLILAAALAAVLVAPSTAAVAPRSFRLPSGNIGCIYTDAAITGHPWLRCDVRSGLKPPPRRPCRLDWVGLILPKAGRAKPECAGDTALEPGAPVLPYGRTWRRGGFTCTSRRTGLRCRNAGGGGFFLSRASWRVY